MKAQVFAAIGMAIAVLAAPQAAQAQKKGAPAVAKKLYCWNDNGTRVCGDALPPEQAALARTEINARSGRPTTEFQRALSAEERVAAASAAGQAQLAAEAEAARKRRDLAMVESYMTEADLQRAFNERIVLVDESIKASVMGEANLRRGLVSLLGHAANLELSRKPVPQPLQDNIRKQHIELGKQLQILDQQRADRATLDGDLADALQRYRDLKGAAAGATTTASATPDPQAATQQQ